MAFFESLKVKALEYLGTARAKLAIVSVSALGLVQYASAATLNESISPKSC